MRLLSRKGNKDVEYDKKGKVIQESCLDEQISLFDKHYVLFFFVPLKESEINSLIPTGKPVGLHDNPE